MLVEHDAHARRVLRLSVVYASLALKHGEIRRTQVDRINDVAEFRLAEHIPLGLYGECDF